MESSGSRRDTGRVSEENIETARGAYVAFNRGDFAGAHENVAPEFEWVATGVIPGSRASIGGLKNSGGSWSRFGMNFDDSHIEVSE